MAAFDQISFFTFEKKPTLYSVDIDADKIAQKNKKKDFLNSENQKQSFRDSFEYFANFTGKYLCWSLDLIKLLAFNCIKRDSNTGVFL